MSDPAMVAAMRAMAERADNRIAQGAIAAREALAPIRAVVEDARMWNPTRTRDIGDAYQADFVHELLDDLARLIYSTDELEKQ